MFVGVFKNCGKCWQNKYFLKILCTCLFFFVFFFLLFSLCVKEVAKKTNLQTKNKKIERGQKKTKYTHKKKQWKMTKKLTNLHQYTRWAKIRTSLVFIRVPTLLWPAKYVAIFGILRVFLNYNVLLFFWVILCKKIKKLKKNCVFFLFFFCFFIFVFETTCNGKIKKCIAKLSYMDTNWIYMWYCIITFITSTYPIVKAFPLFPHTFLNERACLILFF